MPADRTAVETLPLFTRCVNGGWIGEKSPVVPRWSTYMAKKYPFATQTNASPPPRSATMEGRAVEVMVASSAVKSPANAIERRIV